jgi:hypothetical protein
MNYLKEIDDIVLEEAKRRKEYFFDNNPNKKPKKLNVLLMVESLVVYKYLKMMVELVPSLNIRPYYYLEYEEKRPSLDYLLLHRDFLQRHYLSLPQSMLTANKNLKLFLISGIGDDLGHLTNVAEKYLDYQESLSVGMKSIDFFHALTDAFERQENVVNSKYIRSVA